MATSNTGARINPEYVLRLSPSNIKDIAARLARKPDTTSVPADGLPILFRYIAGGAVSGGYASTELDFRHLVASGKKVIITDNFLANHPRISIGGEDVDIVQHVAAILVIKESAQPSLLSLADRVNASIAMGLADGVLCQYRNVGSSNNPEAVSIVFRQNSADCKGSQEVTLMPREQISLIPLGDNKQFCGIYRGEIPVLRPSQSDLDLLQTAENIASCARGANPMHKVGLAFNVESALNLFYMLALNYGKYELDFGKMAEILGRIFERAAQRKDDQVTICMPKLDLRAAGDAALCELAMELDKTTNEFVSGDKLCDDAFLALYQRVNIARVTKQKSLAELRKQSPRVVAGFQDQDTGIAELVLDFLSQTHNLGNPEKETPDEIELRTRMKEIADKVRATGSMELACRIKGLYQAVIAEVCKAINLEEYKGEVFIAFPGVRNIAHLKIALEELSKAEKFQGFTEGTLKTIAVIDTPLEGEQIRDMAQVVSAIHISGNYFTARVEGLSPGSLRSLDEYMEKHRVNPFVTLTADTEKQIVNICEAARLVNGDIRIIYEGHQSLDPLSLEVLARHNIEVCVFPTEEAKALHVIVAAQNALRHPQLPLGGQNPEAASEASTGERAQLLVRAPLPA